MNKSRLSRRRFLRNSSYGFIAAGMIPGERPFIPAVENQEPELPIIKEYRTLGRTGFRVSDISSGAPRNETILKTLLNAGVNFIDTGEDYDNGNNERLIGKVLKEFDRKKIFILSKLYSEEKKFNGKEDVLNRVRKALERLETDYIDCIGIHEVTSSEHLKEENFHAAMSQLKSEGRVRFTGCSCHGNAHLADPEESIDKVLMSAVDDGRFDVFLLTYNFMNAPQADPVLNTCQEKGIGTAIMKSNPVMIYEILDGYIRKIEEKGDTVPDYYTVFHDKYLKQNEYAKEFFKKYNANNSEELTRAAQLFVLSNPKAHTTCIDFRNLADVEMLIGLSGKKLEPFHADLLNNYRDHFGYLNCRTGCNLCESACPYKVPVNTILRYNYYYQKKGDQKHAMNLYRNLKTALPVMCEQCPGYCEDKCPYGVAAKGLLAVAHDNLNFPDSFYSTT
jgi:predicted aldo/keto reductase-like oxidoreductase